MNLITWGYRSVNRLTSGRFTFASFKAYSRAHCDMWSQPLELRLSRAQNRERTNILGDVVPIVIHLMMENGRGVWGEACYPVVE